MRNEIAQVISQNQAMELVYGNNCNPKKILGRHMVNQGQVISAYHPDAVKMFVIDEFGKRHEMEPVERLSVFAIYFPTNRTFGYQIEMIFRDGNHYISEDPYCYDSVITPEEEAMFCDSSWKNSYQKLGAHPMTLQGVEGVYFAVWAPHARRVSVVGDFNFWNGMIYPMQRLERSGIFELFIPHVKAKALYRYEIKTADSNIVQKVDPVGSMNLDGVGDASIVLNMKEFIWTDQQWMKDRYYKNWKHTPFAVCDREFTDVSQQEFLDYGCFTHVILKSPGFCHGMRGKIREWINDLHRRGIGVLLEMSLGLFTTEENGLKYFDGTSLYGHRDQRLHDDEQHKMIRFHHDSREVNNYLLTNLIFWIREYHVDGFIFKGMTEMIYPAYTEIVDGRKVYHTIYQPEAEDFLCHAVREVKKEDISVLVIADEKMEETEHNLQLVYSKAPFDALLNYSVPKNLSEYLIGAAKEQGRDYYKLSLPLMKNGMRNTLLNLAIQSTVHFQEAFLQEAFLNEYDKLSWRKLTMGYMMGAPGRKRWSWKNMESVAVQNYLKKLFQLYLSHNCMWSREPLKTSFSWINGMDAKNQLLSFVRRAPGNGKSLLFLCNFSRSRKQSHLIGVPKYGQYKLLLNSDAEEFGGAIRQDEDICFEATTQEWDLQPYSIRVTISGLSVLIFEY